MYAARGKQPAINGQEKEASLLQMWPKRPHWNPCRLPTEKQMVSPPTHIPEETANEGETEKEVTQENQREGI